MHSFAEHPKVVGQHEVVNYQVEGNASDLKEGNVGQWGNNVVVVVAIWTGPTGCTAIKFGLPTTSLYQASQDRQLRARDTNKLMWMRVRVQRRALKKTRNSHRCNILQCATGGSSPEPYEYGQRQHQCREGHGIADHK